MAQPLHDIESSPTCDQSHDGSVSSLPTIKPQHLVPITVQRSDTTATAGHKSITTALLSLTATEPAGASPVTRTLEETFRRHPIRPWALTFVDGSIERDFMLQYNIKSFAYNKLIMVTGVFGLFLYGSLFALIVGPYYETYIMISCVSFGVAGYILFRCLSQKTIEKYAYIYVAMFVWLFFAPLFIASYYFPSRNAILEKFQVFRQFVYATSVTMIFIATAIVHHPFVIALAIGIFLVCAPWITVTFATETMDPLGFITIPGFYAVIALTSLLTVRERELKFRRIYLMERVMAERNILSVEIVSEMSSTDIIGLLKARNTNKGEEISKENEVESISRWARWKRWVRQKVLVKCEDKAFEVKYLLWRQKPFIFQVRQSLYVLALFDLLSAFINITSYCNESGRMTISPSFCGSKGITIRNIRLTFPPLLVGAALLTHVKKVNESTQISQWLFVITLSIRGLILEAIYGTMMKQDPKDETSSLILSTIIGMLFVGCGSAVLLIDMFLILSGVLFVGSILTMIATKTVLMFLVLLLCVAIPLSVFFNISMEKCEIRFFALWEGLCNGE